MTIEKGHLSEVPATLSPEEFLRSLSDFSKSQGMSLHRLGLQVYQEKMDNRGKIFGKTVPCVLEKVDNISVYYGDRGLFVISSPLNLKGMYLVQTQQRGNNQVRTTIEIDKLPSDFNIAKLNPPRKGPILNKTLIDPVSRAKLSYSNTISWRELARYVDIWTDENGDDMSVPITFGGVANNEARINPIRCDEFLTDFIASIYPLNIGRLYPRNYSPTNTN